MTANTTESIRERTTKVPLKLPFNSICKKWLETTDGFWTSISETLRTVITEFGKTHSDYYASNDAHAMDTGIRSTATVARTPSNVARANLA